MTLAFARRPLGTFMAALLMAALLLPAAQAGAALGELVSVIVRQAPGAGDLPERIVESNGGSVGTQLPIIDGFSAEVPRRSVASLSAHAAIDSITPNVALELQGGEYAAGSDVGSMHTTNRLIGATAYWAKGFTGSGVDVAIIDSGVSPVQGLNGSGKVVRGPDLSFESQAPNLRYLDTFGHGTFMAGLIAGHDTGAKVNPGQAVRGYSGVAPGARIVSIKVANANGATDVSQVIAAIDWVVQHRRDAGLNIRVLNLSFGTYGSQPYALDPLAFAAEVAWHSGLFVVVAAGNNAPASGALMNPAKDPYLMAVGASDPSGSVPTSDDVLLASSARGDGIRNPDLVAPGRSLQGLRVPGSHIDAAFPGGRLSDRFFRGSGTSQAAAIVSGAAALVIQQRPQIGPDELKALLTSTAQALPAADGRGQGAGLLNLGTALQTPTPPAVQTWQRSTGTGSLEAARGSSRLTLDGVLLTGERDIFGAPFDAAAMVPATLAGQTWTGGTWNGSAWTGDGWAGNEWSTIEWSGASWSGNEWSTYTWSGNEWSGNEWSGNEWSANEWSANEWSANEWSANEWSANEWSASGWQSAEWSSGR
jgi:serine protease AprX